jgi:hypothetical protein
MLRFNKSLLPILLLFYVILISACDISEGLTGSSGGKEIIDYYQDSDGDGYGNPDISQKSTVKPSGYVTDNADCNDNDASINPGADDTPCDGADNDCDNIIDNIKTWYKDFDSDGYSDGTSSTQCPIPSGYKLPHELIDISGDCDDSDAGISPGADDTPCDGIDNDCDNIIDNIDTWYKDFDSDGYSDGTSSTQCPIPFGYKLLHKLIDISGDCNDSDAGINPGVYDIICDGIDMDCDGEDCSDDCLEENDTRITATDVIIYKNKWIGNILCDLVSSDDDYYKINVSHGNENVVSTVTFTHSKGNIDLELLDYSGKILKSSYSLNDDEYINTVVPGSGFYYLRIFPRGTGVINNYNFSWNAEPICYSYDTTIHCGETKDNSTTNNTNRLDNYSCKPSWDESGPDEIYKIVVGGTTDITANLDVSGDIDLDLFILSDSSGKVCATNCIDYGDDLITYNNAPAGTYYIVVDGYSGDKGSYTLDITCE